MNEHALHAFMHASGTCTSSRRGDVAYCCEESMQTVMVMSPHVMVVSPHQTTVVHYSGAKGRCYRAMSFNFTLYVVALIRKSLVSSDIKKSLVTFSESYKSCMYFDGGMFMHEHDGMLMHEHFIQMHVPLLNQTVQHSVSRE